MPLYNTATSATALGVSAKWLDNLLSHHNIAGVQSAKQGVPRRLSDDAIEIIAAVKVLTEAGMASREAVITAERLHANPEQAIHLGAGIMLTIDRRRLANQIRAHLAQAVEITPIPLRGRPARP